jgi:hypothetical protein
VFWLNSKDMDTSKRGRRGAAGRRYLEHSSFVHLTSIKEQDEQDKVDETSEALTANPQWLLIYSHDGKQKLLGISGPGVFLVKPFLPEARQVITTRSSQLKTGHLIPVRKLQDMQDSRSYVSQEDCENSK